MKNSYKFFCNKECEFWPCHQDLPPDQINCLFCYCPLYSRSCNEYGGTPHFYYYAGKWTKDCSSCSWNHLPESYDKIVDILMH